MLSLIKLILEIKHINPKKEGYIYYKDPGVWIKWTNIYRKHKNYDDGFMWGEDLSGNFYDAEVNFLSRSGADIDFNTVRNIKLVK